MFLFVLCFEVLAAFQRVKFLLYVRELVSDFLVFSRFFLCFVPLCFEGIGNTGVFLYNRRYLVIRKGQRFKELS